jgi:hypothetical protein
MKISREQYNKLPTEYKQYFNKVGGDAGSDEYIKNIHPT